MIQTVQEALSGFSIVLFTAIVAVIFIAGTVLIIGAICIAGIKIIRLAEKEIPLSTKLAAKTLMRAKKEKPSIVKIRGVKP